MIPSANRVWQSTKKLWATYQRSLAISRFVNSGWATNANVFFAPELVYPECAVREAIDHSRVPPYVALAPLWHEIASSWMPDYAGFLRFFAKQAGIQLNSVLDAGCGTGILSIRLARVAREVVGLDVSDSMLTEARRCLGNVPNVNYVLGDFRDFHLSRQFDASTCVNDSLNYVADIAELTAALRCVAAHLRPNGIFIFDTLTERGMLATSGLYMHAWLNKKRFAIRCDYDSHARKASDLVLLPTGVELHTRIPLDPAEVLAALPGTDFVLEESFCNRSLVEQWRASRAYFILRKTS